ncbi:hypothetical protein WR25_01161 [Diploscapter pachys]|uniref:Uncharacterized protein n=1 Tax=Diploscapter pachys TaxID=2018661 RepID=A0A2A2KBI8_9BILA|nr:hypothetical protein WR25_01161 [Diploscapter pachys]
MKKILEPIASTDRIPINVASKSIWCETKDTSETRRAGITTLSIPVTVIFDQLKSINDDDDFFRSNSLIDSGGYQSILPDLRPTFVPTPAPRLSTSLSSSMSYLETSSGSLSGSGPAPPVPPTKPTVEVHPMPNEERVPLPQSQGFNKSMDSDMLKKQKPAVPAKPKGLLIDHMSSYHVENSSVLMPEHEILLAEQKYPILNTN